MRLHTRQLACLLLLLSTLGMAAGASEASAAGFRGTAIEAMLYRSALENRAAEPVAKAVTSPRVDAAQADLPVAGRESLRAVWPVAAASAQAASTRAVQSFPALVV
jgi:hypothetical protein